MIILTLTLLLLTSLCCTSALAAGGDVAGAVEQTWTEAAKQIKSVVEKGPDCLTTRSVLRFSPLAATIL